MYKYANKICIKVQHYSERQSSKKNKHSYVNFIKHLTVQKSNNITAMMTTITS